MGRRAILKRDQVHTVEIDGINFQVRLFRPDQEYNLSVFEMAPFLHGIVPTPEASVESNDKIGVPWATRKDIEKFIYLISESVDVVDVDGAEECKTSYEVLYNLPFGTVRKLGKEILNMTSLSPVEEQD